jgi:hypothetical protein
MSLLYSWQGDSLYDAVGNQLLSAYNHFGDSTSTLQAPGKIGLGYDVGNGSYIVFPIGFDASSPRTITFWIYIKKASLQTPQTIFYNTWTGGSSDTYKLEISGDHFVWNYFDGVTRTAVDITSILPTDDTWYHIRFVYSSGTQWLYINNTVATEVNGLSATIQTSGFNSGTFGNNDDDEYIIGDCILDIVNCYDDATSNDYHSGSGFERYITATGGVLLRPTSVDVNFQSFFTDSVNVVVSGTAGEFMAFEPTGGLVVSGEAPNISSYHMDGGAFVRGHARIQKIPAPFRFDDGDHEEIKTLDTAEVSLVTRTDVVYNETGDSGAIVSGTAIVLSPISSVTASGGVVVAGNGIFGLSMFASGEIEIDGIAESESASIFTQTFSWDVEKNIAIEKEFTWNLGEIPLSWYRVEGKCTSNATCDTHGFDLVNGCGYVTYIQVIAARGLSDLCSKLKEGKLFKPVVWPLQSITKRNNPVYKTETDSSCDVFEEEIFCDVPECRDFCLDESVYFRATLDFFIQDNFLLYEGSGSLSIGGLATTSSAGGTEANYSFEGSGILDVSGIADTAKQAEYDEEGSGGVLLSGEGIIVCPNYAYESFINTIVSGTAYVESSLYSYEGESGLTSGGSGFYGVGLVGEGTITIGGVADTTPNLYHVAQGSVEIDGEALSTSEAYSWIGSGELEIGGSATYISSYAGAYVQDFTLNMSIERTYLGFIEDSLTDTLAPDTSTVISCSCADIPLVLSISHNLNQENQLYRFLSRNGLDLPNTTSLNYKSSSNSWYFAHHFKGKGEQDNNLERWLINFNWKCSEDIDSISDGVFWNLKISIRKENLVTYEDIVTRMSFTLPTSAFCRDTENKVTLNYNIKNYSLTTDLSFAELDYFEDNIGLFKNKYWNNNPSLNIAISDEISVTPLPRYNYGKFFPKNVDSIFS